MAWGACSWWWGPLPLNSTALPFLLWYWARKKGDEVWKEEETDVWLCKLLHGPWKGLSLPSYFHGRSVWLTSFLGPQLPSGHKVYLMDISFCCFLKLQRTLLFRCESQLRPCTTFHSVLLDIWETHDITHTITTLKQYQTPHAFLPFLHFYHPVLRFSVSSGRFRRSWTD